jgi:MFS family permease
MSEDQMVAFVERWRRALREAEGWPRTLALLWLAQCAAMAGLSLVLPFLPLFLGELGVQEPGQVRVWTGRVVAASFFCMALAEPLWGTLADRCGRKPMVLRSLWGVALAIGLMSGARTPGQLFALRCLQGCLGGGGAASVTLIASVAPRQRMGTAIGLLLTANMVGSSLGPLMGGGLAAKWGYRWLFIVTGGILGIVGFLVLLLVRERFDRAAAKGDAAWRDTLRLPLTYPRLRQVVVLVGLTQMAMLAAQTMTPLYVAQLTKKAVPWMVGLTFSAPAMANLLASPLWGRASDRRGAGRTLCWALFGTAAAYAPQAFVRSVWQLLPCRALLGLFTPGVNPTASALVAQDVPPERVGRGLAWLNSARTLGSAFGSLWAGSMAARWGLPRVFLITTGLLLIGTLGAWRLRGSERKGT